MTQDEPKVLQPMAFYIVASKQGRVLKSLPAMGCHHDDNGRTYAAARSLNDEIKGADYVELRWINRVMQVWPITEPLREGGTLTATFSFTWNYTPPETVPEDAHQLASMGHYTPSRNRVPVLYGSDGKPAPGLLHRVLDMFGLV